MVASFEFIYIFFEIYLFIASSRVSGLEDTLKARDTTIESLRKEIDDLKKVRYSWNIIDANDRWTISLKCSHKNCIVR